MCILRRYIGKTIYKYIYIYIILYIYYIYIYYYIYIHIYIYIIYIYMGSSGNTVSPLEGLSRGYASGFASGFASGVCFGVCFAWTSSHGTYFISQRLPTNFPIFDISLCISLHAYIWEREGHVWFSGLNQPPRARVWLSPSTGEAQG